MTQRNLYDILAVSKTATPQQIRAAHRAMSRRYHPDTADDGKGDPRAFAAVQEAYETLANSDVRRRYDHKTTGRVETPGKSRRPPKSPCAVCSRPVYASQLKLYLGRHMCMLCFEKKRQRDQNRARISGINEVAWRLKRLSVWAQSHIAVLSVVAVALGLAGTRVAWTLSQSHHEDEVIPAQHDATTAVKAAGATAVSSRTAPAPGPMNPCAIPTSSTASADVRTVR